MKSERGKRAFGRAPDSSGAAGVKRREMGVERGACSGSAPGSDSFATLPWTRNPRCKCDTHTHTPREEMGLPPAHSHHARRAPRAAHAPPSCPAPPHRQHVTGGRGAVAGAQHRWPRAPQDRHNAAARSAAGGSHGRPPGPSPAHPTRAHRRQGAGRVVAEDVQARAWWPAWPQRKQRATRRGGWWGVGRCRQRRLASSLLPPLLVPLGHAARSCPSSPQAKHGLSGAGAEHSRWRWRPPQR